MDDEALMRWALEIGRTAAGKTGENPAVGCVLARGEEVVAAGATQPPGGPHAEVVALKEAEANGVVIAECDMYVTLEPCTFQGRTPPCVEAILANRPRRVVVAVRDPHPRVNGGGIRRLRSAGLEVVEGVLADEAREALRPWFDRFGTVRDT